MGHHSSVLIKVLCTDSVNSICLVRCGRLLIRHSSFSYEGQQLDLFTIVFKLTHARSIVNGNIFVEESWSSKNYLTFIHDNRITLCLVLIEIKFNQNKTLLLHIQDVQLIHDSLYGLGWGSAFSPTFSIILDDTALMQLQLFTITL